MKQQHWGPRVQKLRFGVISALFLLPALSFIRYTVMSLGYTLPHSFFLPRIVWNLGLLKKCLETTSFWWWFVKCLGKPDGACDCCFVECPFIMHFWALALALVFPFWMPSYMKLCPPCVKCLWECFLEPGPLHCMRCKWMS